MNEPNIHSDKFLFFELLNNLSEGWILIIHPQKCDREREGRKYGTKILYYARNSHASFVYVLEWKYIYFKALSFVICLKFFCLLFRCFKHFYNKLFKTFQIY